MHFWGRNYFIFLIHGCCWLLWLLLYIFMAADSFGVCSMFFNNIFTISKICFDMYKYIPRIIVNWLQSSQVCGQRHMLRMIVILVKILCFSRYECEWPLAWHGVPQVTCEQTKSVGDLSCGMVSHKSHVSELKKWMPKYSKKSQVSV